MFSMRDISRKLKQSERRNLITRYKLAYVWFSKICNFMVIAIVVVVNKCILLSNEFPM